MKVKQYGVWVEEILNDKNEVDDGGYWLMYDTLEDAVSDNGKTDVYRLTAKRLGQYRRAIKMVKIKKRKIAKKN